MASSRFDNLYLSQTRDRTYWILWLEWDDADGKESQVRAYMRTDGQDMESVAAKLITCAYRSEETECDELGIPHQFVAGVLSKERWNAILNGLWIRSI